MVMLFRPIVVWPDTSSVFRVSLAPPSLMQTTPLIHIQLEPSLFPVWLVALGITLISSTTCLVPWYRWEC